VSLEEEGANERAKGTESHRAHGVGLRARAGTSARGGSRSSSSRRSEDRSAAAAAALRVSLATGGCGSSRIAGTSSNDWRLVTLGWVLKCSSSVVDHIAAGGGFSQIGGDRVTLRVCDGETGGEEDIRGCRSRKLVKVDGCVGYHLEAKSKGVEKIRKKCSQLGKYTSNSGWQNP